MLLISFTKNNPAYIVIVMVTILNNSILFNTLFAYGM